MKAYFSGLDIDPDETKIIFTLLDPPRDVARARAMHAMHASRIRWLAFLFSRVKTSEEWNTSKQVPSQAVGPVGLWLPGMHP